MNKLKTIFFVSVFLLIAFLIFIILIKDRLPEVMFYFDDIGTYSIPDKSVEVNSKNKYSHTFVSNFNNLFMISVFVPKQNLDKDGMLYFYLKDEKNKTKDLVSLRWDFRQIRHKRNSFYLTHPTADSKTQGFNFYIRFPAIKNSKNKKFYFSFETPQSKPGEGIKLGFWDDLHYYEALTEGEMFKNDIPIEGFLAFRTYNTYLGDRGEILEVIFSRLSVDKGFLSFYLAIVISTAVAFMSINPTSYP